MADQRTMPEWTTRPWEAEVEVDAAEAGRRIGERFPELAGKPVQPFGAGWDNTAFLVDGTWVFRFPRKAFAVQFLRAEIAAMPWLGPLLPWPVTTPVWIDDGPAPFAGYRLLPGRPLVEAEWPDEALAALAVPLARFLRVLHAVPADEAAARGVRVDPIGKGDVRGRAPKVAAHLDDLEAAGHVDAGPLRSILDAEPPASRAVLHGDLDARHVLVDRGAVTGVIDWGDVHLGPAGTDLAAMWHVLPVAAHDAFRAAYGPIDPADERFARFRALDVACAVLRWGLDAHNPVAADAGRRTLSRLYATSVMC